MAARTAKIRIAKVVPLATLALALGFPAIAADTVSRQPPAVDACAKTVGAMGASMGHTSEVAPDGRPIYRFHLRQNGLDYDVICDGATGVVGDVTPRAAH